MRVASVLGMIVVLLLAASAMAQSPIKFGIKGGLTLASLSGDGWDDVEDYIGVTLDNKSKMGFCGGVFVDLPLGASGVSLQPELLYVMKGAKAETTTNSGTITLNIKNDYLEVPVLIKYNITAQGNLTPCIFVGPVLAFNMASKIEAEDVSEDLLDDVPDGDIENTKSMDFGLTIGGGFGLAMGPVHKLTFDLRYTVGLSEILDDVAAADFNETLVYIVNDDGSAPAFKNNDIRLMVGFQF
jgi:hypothetical protein